MSSLVSLVWLPLRLVLRISSHMSKTLSRVVHTDLLIIRWAEDAIIHILLVVYVWLITTRPKT